MLRIFRVWLPVDALTILVIDAFQGDDILLSLQVAGGKYKQIGGKPLNVQLANLRFATIRRELPETHIEPRR